MPDQLKIEPYVGLSEEEKKDLEQLISDFQSERQLDHPADDIAALRQHIDTMNERLAFLTKMFLTLDRRFKPLYDTIRLTYKKSEILDQRINVLIHSIRTGEPL